MAETPIFLNVTSRYLILRKELAVNGAQTAKVNYNIDEGWVKASQFSMAKTSPAEVMIKIRKECPVELLANGWCVFSTYMGSIIVLQEIPFFCDNIIR